jgi:hypothetical protein
MQFLKDLINTLSRPEIFITLSTVAFFALQLTRAAWTRSSFWVGNLMITGFFGLSALDPNFRIIITKPDNVPIMIMVYTVWWCLWAAMSQAVANDRRIEMGLPPDEVEDGAKKVWCWPDLVYIELLSMLVLGALLVIWSIYLKAPLEEPANPADSPNPAKAPWYFLGLQEMLVYYDPWLAGVVFPGLIIVGLMALPYIDPNPLGNGYYTFKQRKFAITWFNFGFIVLWVVLIFLGTFLRGPNWNFYGPYEYWDAHKLEVLVNVNLSEMFWISGLGQPLPDSWMIREAPGFLLMIAYFAIGAFVLTRTYFKKFYGQMTTVRYQILVGLWLVMMALPIKMVLRWLLNLKYIVAIPEFFFNI